MRLPSGAIIIEYQLNSVHFVLISMTCWKELIADVTLEKGSRLLEKILEKKRAHCIYRIRNERLQNTSQQMFYAVVKVNKCAQETQRHRQRTFRRLFFVRNTNLQKSCR